MYLRMLDETVKRLMRGDTAPKLHPSDVTIDLPSYLPDEYVTSQDAKLDIYRRLTHLVDIAEIDALRAEVRDRFGPLPPPAETFFSEPLRSSPCCCVATRHVLLLESTPCPA